MTIPPFPLKSREGQSRMDDALASCRRMPTSPPLEACPARSQSKPQGMPVTRAQGIPAYAGMMRGEGMTRAYPKRKIIRINMNFDRLYIKTLKMVIFGNFAIFLRFFLYLCLQRNFNH